MSADDNVEVGKVLFFARQGKNASNESTWLLTYDNWKQMFETIINVNSCSLPANSILDVLESFAAYVSIQIHLVKKLVYMKHPILGMYFNEVLPVRLPFPGETSSPLWSRSYKYSNVFTLTDTFTTKMPTGVKHFAAELLMRHPTLQHNGMQWLALICLFQVPVNLLPNDSPTLIPEALAMVSRSFAQEWLRPWMGQPPDIQVKIVHRRSLNRQIKWTIPGSPDKTLYLFW